VSVETWIEKIGTSPYAVVVGLLLSAIPVLIPIVRGSITLVKNLWGAIDNGLAQQVIRIRIRNALRARKIIDLDSLISFLYVNALSFMMRSFYYLIMTVFMNAIIISSILTSSHPARHDWRTFGVISGTMIVLILVYFIQSFFRILRDWGTLKARSDLIRRQKVRELF